MWIGLAGPDRIEALVLTSNRTRCASNPRTERMNHFTLFAHGESFDVDAYLRVTSLTFDSVWRRGDLRGCAQFIQNKHPTSGVRKELGCGWELPIHEQDRIATDFLATNEVALKHLAQFPGVDTFILGLHYRIALTPGVCGFCMSASPRLMNFALRIGIDPTFYVDLDRKDLNGDE